MWYFQFYAFFSYCIISSQLLISIVIYNYNIYVNVYNASMHLCAVY